MTPYYSDAAVTIHHGNAFDLPLGDASVDLVVTSPPYFGLRSYQDDGAHYAGQIGSEATPGEFLDALIAATAEMVRVLKPSGSIFVNLGDKYSGGNSGESGLAKLGEQYRGGGHTQAKAKTRTPVVPGTRPKSLLGIPWRYAIRCIDDLGLILRAEVIWAKPNGLPESVGDRVRRSHEQWFHFTREPRYFSAVDEIREGYNNPGKNYGPTGGRPNRLTAPDDLRTGTQGRVMDEMNPRGKLPGSVWTIPTEPLTVPDHLDVDHFAAFPLEWPLRIIRGWSPSGICTVCGDGRRPVTSRERTLEPGRRVHGLGATHTGGRVGPQTGGPSEASSLHHLNTYRVESYACACPDTTAPTRPAVVLDSFAGTGTTLLAAKALGRLGIGNDLSADYCRLMQWRCTDPGELAKAMRVEKPAPVIDGQGSLLDELEVTG